LARDGATLAQRDGGPGILAVTDGRFGDALDREIGGWLDECGGVPVVLSGMIGSRQGWVEAPYLACPAEANDVASALFPHDGERLGTLHFVPGLAMDADGAMPDVMRGEECQVFGALANSRAGQVGDCLFVLPGTHSKWVRVRSSRIEGFTTYMTGEFYALLRRHSILSRTLPPDDGPLDASAFDQGVAHALNGPSLLATAFSARTLSLFERMAAESLPSYLSGLVIGEELRAQPAVPDAVVVIGSPELAGRYQRALAQRSVTTHAVGHEATWQGLWAISRTLES